MEHLDIVEFTLDITLAVKLPALSLAVVVSYFALLASLRLCHKLLIVLLRLILHEQAHELSDCIHLTLLHYSLIILLL